MHDGLQLLVVKCWLYVSHWKPNCTGAVVHVIAAIIQRFIAVYSFWVSYSSKYSAQHSQAPETQTWKAHKRGKEQTLIRVLPADC